MKKSTKAIIITRDGKKYNNEGNVHVMRTLALDMGVTGDIVCFSGHTYNNPKVLKAALKADNDTYVILSTKDDICYIPKKNNDAICANIDERLGINPKATSWEIIMESCNKTLY